MDGETTHEIWSLTRILYDNDSVFYLQMSKHHIHTLTKNTIVNYSILS